jgi:hypothetical protein
MSDPKHFPLVGLAAVLTLFALVCHVSPTISVPILLFLAFLMLVRGT